MSRDQLPPSDAFGAERPPGGRFRRVAPRGWTRGEVARRPGTAPPSPARDELLNTMCVERADGTVEAHYTDSTLPEDVRALIAWADGRPERRDDLER